MGDGDLQARTSWQLWMRDSPLDGWVGLVCVAEDVCCSDNFEQSQKQKLAAEEEARKMSKQDRMDKRYVEVQQSFAKNKKKRDKAKEKRAAQILADPAKFTSR